MGIKKRFGRAILATAVLVGGGLANASAPAVAGGPSANAEARSVAPSSVSARSAVAPLARPKGEQVVLKGRTLGKAIKVRVKRWKPKARTWAPVTTSQSRNHKYRITVTGKRAITAERLKVKPRNERAQVVALSDACGVRPTKADGTLWACTFSDEFNGTSLDRTKWLPQVWGYTTGDKTNFACYKDDPQNVSVANGALRLTLREGAAEPCAELKGSPVTRFSAGAVSTYRLHSQRYGRFEARTRNTAATVGGLHEAFWLWPDDREVNTTLWPASGEIDISETYSSYPTLAIPYLHYVALGKWGATLIGKHTNTAWTCYAERGVWNTWTLDWSATQIDIYVNGKLCMTNRSANAAFNEKFILAFTQGIGGDHNTWSTRTPMPATFEVDWVRAWQ